MGVTVSPLKTLCIIGKYIFKSLSLSVFPRLSTLFLIIMFHFFAATLFKIMLTKYWVSDPYDQILCADAGKDTAL